VSTVSAGALKSEGEGDPAGQHAGRDPGQQVPLDAVGVAVVRQGHAVAGAVAADEDAGRGAAQRARVDASPFQRLPGDLEQQPLLRVHRQGLARADAEELRVELARVVQEPATPGIGGTRVVGVGVVQLIGAPATVGREVGDRVGAVRDEPPEVLGGAHSTGEPAPHADDGYGLLLPVLNLAQAPARLTQISGHKLEVIAKLIFVSHSPSPFHEPANDAQNCNIRFWLIFDSGKPTES
jgi:hypothetical protein